MLQTGKKPDEEEEEERPPLDHIYYTIRNEGLFLAGFRPKQNELAIKSLSQALSRNPTEKLCLTARAHCYLRMKMPELALQDANVALETEDEKSPHQYVQALYAKAEALFELGDFETALIFYHRGRRRSPKDIKFRVGIKKCVVTINNSIGAPDSVHLKAVKSSPQTKAEPIKLRRATCTSIDSPTRMKTSCTNLEARQLSELLGPLYHDYQCLDRLHKKMSLESVRFLMTQGFRGKRNFDSAEVKRLVIEALNFLTNRAEFWRDQRPIYARQRDRRNLLQGAPRHPKSTDYGRELLRILEQIDLALETRDFATGFRQAERVMSRLLSLGDEFLQNRLGLASLVFNALGIACVEMGLLEHALYYHHLDFHVGMLSSDVEIKSRAADNMGVANARMGHYEKAIQIWKSNAAKPRTATEVAWMHYEIGRCHLQINRFLQAKEEAIKCLQAAEDIQNYRWQMHALVLLGEAEVALEEHIEVARAFERAWTMAKKIKDVKSQSAIKRAYLTLTGTELEGEVDEHKEDQEESMTEQTIRRGVLLRARAEKKGWRFTSGTCKQMGNFYKLEQNAASMHKFLTSDSTCDNCDETTEMPYLEDRLWDWKAVEKKATESDAVKKKKRDAKTVKRTTFAEPPDHSGPLMSKNTNNPVLGSVGTSEESVNKEATDAVFKRVTPHKTKGKRNSKVKYAEPQSNRDAVERKITFKPKQVSRPQTANLIRPKLVINQRPQTAEHQQRKLVQPKAPPTPKACQRTKKDSVARTKGTASVFPPSRGVTRMTGAATCRQPGVSPHEGCHHKPRSPDARQHENRSNSSVCHYDLFNVSSSEPSDEDTVFDNDNDQFSNVSLANEFTWNTNVDDRHDTAEKLQGKAQQDTFYTVSDTSAADSNTSGFRKPHPSEKFSGDERKSCTSVGSRSCYSLPPSPFRTGSDTHALQVGHSKSDSSSTIFYSDSHIKKWMADVQQMCHLPVYVGDTGSDDTVQDTAHVTLNYDSSLEDLDINTQDQEWMDGHNQDTRLLEISGSEQSTSQPYKSKVSQQQTQTDDVPEPEANLNGNNVHRRHGSANSRRDRVLAPFALMVPNEPLLKGMRKKSTAGQTVSSAKISFPSSASTCQKNATANTHHQLYEPRRLSMQPPTIEKERPKKRRGVTP